MIPSEEDPPSITVLVLNYNGRKYLKPCLDSLLATRYLGLRIVVVDNGSTDDSLELVRRDYHGVRIIKNSKNLGYASAMNLAMESVESEYVVFLNQDIIVEPAWLQNLVRHMKTERVAAVNPKILFLKDKETINAAGGSCDIYGVGWNRGNGEFDKGQFDVTEQVFYVNGGAFLTKRDRWKDVGPFDERYFMYCEDLDWCWRARLKGYKILYVPSARIYHHWQGSEGFIVESLERHWLATFLKNYSLKTILLLLPKYLALKALKALWLMEKGEKKNERFAVFQSFMWNLTHFKSTWTKHLSVQASRRISDKEIQHYMYAGSFELSAWTGKVRHPLVKRIRENRTRDHTLLG